LSESYVVTVDAGLASRAIAGTREWQVSFCDALIVRAAESTACSVVLSEDLAADMAYGSVSVRDPFR